MSKTFKYSDAIHSHSCHIVRYAYMLMLSKDMRNDNICTWSTALGPVHGNHYPLDIFITPCWRKSWSQPERQKQRAKVAPWCQCGASEFCVEIISLFRCHLASGCWHVGQARCSMGNTTESHLHTTRAYEWHWIQWNALRALSRTSANHRGEAVFRERKLKCVDIKKTAEKRKKNCDKTSF